MNGRLWFYCVNFCLYASRLWGGGGGCVHVKSVFTFVQELRYTREALVQLTDSLAFIFL